MLQVSLAQMKADIIPMLKGTSLRQIRDFYGTVAKASNRMLARLDPEETRRTMTLASPFYASVRDYVMANDYKRMIDIRPQTIRRGPGDSNFNQTAARQFREKIRPNTFSIGWNNMVRTLRAQVLPDASIISLDSFDGPSANGLWVASNDASGLYTEPLNYVQGNGSLGLNLSGVTGIGTITNSTVPAALDLSSFLNEDSSFIFFYLPVGTGTRFNGFTFLRGDNALNYRSVLVTTRQDGTAFQDGWNFIANPWWLGSNTGSPTNKSNQYRQITINYSIGVAINGFLIDSWTNDLGKIYEMEYYSEYMFRTALGVWIQTPTQDSDLVNVGTASYEILKTEMMIDITQEIRTGNVRQAELNDWRLMLNGQPESRYVKDPKYRGLYADYMRQFPSSSIVEATQYYEFDL